MFSISAGIRSWFLDLLRYHCIQTTASLSSFSSVVVALIFDGCLSAHFVVIEPLRMSKRSGHSGLMMKLVSIIALFAVI